MGCEEQKGGHKRGAENNDKVHFASLMDLSHLKNSELEPQFQKYKGRVVLQGDNVEEDSGLNSCASWKPVNPQECVWENLYRIYQEDHIAERGVNSLQYQNLVRKFILMPQAMKIPAAEAAVDKEREKLEKIPA